jgi:glycogen debranching enzyme
MPITFDRSICCDLNETIKREWLVTNGLGGYAAGTIAGVLTRLQHGLLVAVPPGVNTPQLLLAKIDEEVVFDERTYYLGTNEYRDGTLNPAGFVHLETFRLEEGLPVFSYHLGGLNGIMLEKRIWMPYGQNTTCIQYRVLRTATDEGFTYNRAGLRSAGSNERHQRSAPHALTLTLLPFSTHRPHATIPQGNGQQQFSVQIHRGEDFIDRDQSPQKIPTGITGCTLQMQDNDPEAAFPYHILVVAHRDSHATFLPTGIWYWNFLRRHEASTGLPATDNLYLPGVFRATLWPGEDAELTLIVTTEEQPSWPVHQDKLRRLYTQSMERQRRLLSGALQPERYFGEGGEAAQARRLHILPLSSTPDPVAGGEEYLHQLVQAADHFLLQRQYPRMEYIGDRQILFDKAEQVPLLFSSFYGLATSTRDILIALPGLLLVTGRNDEALKLLRELARSFRGGLLPDQFPQPGRPLSEHDYNNADVTLWFFYALDLYLRTTRTVTPPEELYNRLADCIERYTQGTDNGIRLDPEDDLLIASQPGKALTWMNSIVDNVPVTPRAGKPVEINALWYHALSLMQEWSQQSRQRGWIKRDTALYERLRTRCRESFQQRFWYEEGGYLYDVIDGPDGNDSALRPNQLFAIALRYPVLDACKRQAVLDILSEHLLTPYGLRTLSSHDAAYRGHAETTPHGYLQATHQGSAWTWLMEPYITALLNVHHRPVRQISLRDELLQREYLWREGLRLLEPIKDTLNLELLGMNAGVFDGDSPYQPCRLSDQQGSALGTSALLRIYDMLARMRVSHPAYALMR